MLRIDNFAIQPKYFVETPKTLNALYIEWFLIGFFGWVLLFEPLGKCYNMQRTKRTKEILIVIATPGDIATTRPIRNHTKRTYLNDYA